MFSVKKGENPISDTIAPKCVYIYDLPFVSVLAVDILI